MPDDMRSLCVIYPSIQPTTRTVRVSLLRNLELHADTVPLENIIVMAKLLVVAEPLPSRRHFPRRVVERNGGPTQRNGINGAG